MDTSERDFEASIEDYLLSAGYAQRRTDHFSRAQCLDAEMTLQFVQATQTQAWLKLKSQFAENARDQFLGTLTKAIQQRGTLDVLRKGISDHGAKFELAYFKPETSLNEEHQRRYQNNLFSIIRQVHFSEKNENSVDLVLFLNGLPIITSELKNPLKGQTVHNAVSQYRYRDPREPLLAFGRSLAHFAVDTDLVFMTTHLKGKDTFFLPFNLGNNSGAGNPDNPHGFKTAYLWEKIWDRDSLLDIIQNFLQTVEEEDENGRKTGRRKLIFPRYHQLDAVRRLTNDARSRGAGHNYLIEHSAGSGKSNSIAWLAHRIAGLHNEQNEPVFDTVIVITDRVVLDRQLQRTVRSFEQTRGLVTGIDKNKAKELAEALQKKRQIITITLQTFPFLSEEIYTRPGGKFAVIIDEAHSSQSGEANRSLKQALSAKSLDEAEVIESEETPDEEDEINREIEEQMKRRGRQKNVSFFAFTATPKPKTLELFGTRQTDGSFRSFSLYSMKQAIEERFILDVLANYTTYKSYFALLQKIKDDPRYDRRKATYLLRRFVDLHPHSIRVKVEIMADHFHDQVRNRISGMAKAMVVTRSRLHAVRYKQEFDKYLKEAAYPHKALVAFSGEVIDPDTGEVFTEARMNGFPESQTTDTFKKPQNRIMIVAEKFQTGFDQPLLHTMYVDKKLGGVHAVQTLSRLNRTHPPDKEDALVLDFVNETGDIQKAFQPYYQATYLSEATDPNKLYELKLILDGFHIYQAETVDEFARQYFKPRGRQQDIHAVLDPVVQNYEQLTPDDRTNLKKRLANYVHLCAFLSQVVSFTDASLEKFYQFARHLFRKLPPDPDTLPVEITEQINMDSYKISQTSTGEIKLLDQAGELKPTTELGETRATVERVPLSEIIKYINENYGTEFTNEDKVRYFADDMEKRLFDQEGLRLALDRENNPTEDLRQLAFHSFFDETLQDMIDSNFDIYKKIADDNQFGMLFKYMMYKRIVEKMGRTANVHAARGES